MSEPPFGLSLQCYEGFRQSAPEEIKIDIKSIEIENSSTPIRTHNVGHITFVKAQIPDSDWLDGGFRIQTIGDRYLGHRVSIRISPNPILIFGVTVTIHPNYWAPNGYTFRIPQSNQLQLGVELNFYFGYQQSQQ